ncbi:hypothetical protein BC832DRAFT_606985 [Gaertneriomyces semiglobifer]|nr:hypothetical protein BC832DRAFT_606985 [Gaertneriomyces semiglobifer]
MMGTTVSPETQTHSHSHTQNHNRQSWDTDIHPEHTTYWPSPTITSTTNSPMINQQQLPQPYKNSFIIIHESTYVDIYGPYSELQEANRIARRLSMEMYLSSNNFSSNTVASNTLSPSFNTSPSFSSSTTADDCLEEYELRKTECGMVSFTGTKHGRTVSIRVLRQSAVWHTTTHPHSHSHPHTHVPDSSNLQIQALQNELSILRSTLHDLCNHLQIEDPTQILDRVDSFLTETQTLKTDKDKLTTDLTQKTTRINTLTESLDTANTDRILIAHRYDALQSLYQTLITSHSVLSDEKQKLEVQIHTLEQEKHTSQQHTPSHTTDVYKQLENDHQKLKHRLKGLSNKYISLKKRLFAAEEEVKRLNGY